MFVKHTSFDLLVYAVKAVTECDAILGGGVLLLFRDSLGLCSIGVGA